MAGGIDWFRWHHGSVTDPKFQLVARKAGVRLGDVIAVWAFVLEKASADSDRGTIGQIDFETLDFLLGTDEGTAARILDAMAQRGLIEGSRIAKWEERQPKKEDESANERKRRQREREHAERMAARVTVEESRDVTQGHADVTPSHAREEERREEERREDSSAPIGAGADAPAVRPGLTAQDQVFAIGVTLLTAADVSDKNARSFLAAQCKGHGPERVLDALQTCAAERAIQPVPRIVEILGRPGKAAARLNPQEALEASNREVARLWAERNADASA